MHGRVTDDEWEIFKEAYQYLADRGVPPPSGSPEAAPWWRSAADDALAADRRWNGHPLMRGLLLALFEYLGKRGKTRGGGDG